MSNQYYNLYQHYCDELEALMTKYQGRSEDAKKLKGALAVNLFKQETEKYLCDKDLPFKVSLINSYIAGSKFEYDLLIVKKDANAFMDLLYCPDDVIAVIESKVNGLYDLDGDTTGIAKAVNRAQELNHKIRFGYITISENIPVNEYKKDGTSTINHWDLTQEYLDQKTKGQNAIYAVILRKGKKIYNEGSDNEFNDFLKWILEG